MHQQPFNKANLIILILSILATFTSSHAASRTLTGSNELGVGLILFGPTGFSGNYFYNKNTSIDAAFSWSLNDDDQKIYMHSTHLWHKPKLINIDNVSLDVYFGAGARLISWDNPPGKENDAEMHFGARASSGIKYLFQSVPIELFSELSLTMDLIPDTDADLNIGIGARYYF